MVVSKNDTVEVEAEMIDNVVDTTGAGDMYAAGFLYGLTQFKTHGECARIGSIVAAEAISHVGARPQTDLRKLLKDKKAV